MIRTVADFEDASAFERYAIQETLGTSPSGPSSSSIDLTEPGPKKIAVNLSENISAGAVSATINKLKPLLFGAAYKVLDLLIELALNSSGLSPTRGRWTFEEKVVHARARAGSLAPLASSAAWDLICDLYVELLELRHALVHRKARVGTYGTLEAVTAQGATVSLAPDEQAEFALAVLTIADATIRGNFAGRVTGRLAERLNRLSRIHGAVPMPNAVDPNQMPVSVRAKLELLPDGRFRLDRDAALSDARTVFSTTTEFDGEFTGRDAAGHERVYGCELEQVPEAEVLFEPDAPPYWLSEAKS